MDRNGAGDGRGWRQDRVGLEAGDSKGLVVL